VQHGGGGGPESDVAPSGLNRTWRLSIQPWEGLQDGVTFITDMEDFRQSLEAYAVPRPIGHPARQARRSSA